MDTRRLFALVALALATTCAGSSLAGEPRREPFEGVYRLAFRTMKDGTTLRPPDVIGRSTYMNGQRVSTVFARKPSGKYVTLVFVADYELTPSEYRERNVMRVFHDPESGKDIVHDTEGWSGTSPVTRTGERVEFTPPSRPGSPARSASLAYEAGRYTATTPDFVDTWEKVQ
jgi:hypothetical protein